MTYSGSKRENAKERSKAGDAAQPNLPSRYWLRAFVTSWLVLAVAQQGASQSPPDPNYQRQQIFGSYQEFKNQLTAAAANPTQLDALWTQLRTAGQTPYAQGNQVALMYRGAAASVQFAGDFNGWNPNSQWQAAKVGASDLWLLEKTLPTDARIDYKIIVNGNWIKDPANPLVMWSGLGTDNSELRMPAYVYPQETVRQPGVARGDLTGNIRMTSARLGHDVNYRVYTPAGYAAQQLKNLPVVYVTDGQEYAADHLGSMTSVLDNLIASGALQPTMAVFIDPRDPATGSNLRMQQYTEKPNFAGFVAEELVSRIDAAYRTLAAPTGRTILGTSLGGQNSAYFGATRSDVFENIAIQSPASFSQSLTNIYNTQPLQSKLDLFVTVGTQSDGGAGTSFASLLANKGYDYTLVQTNEGHSWGQWRGLLDNILVKLVGPHPALAGDFNDDGGVDNADLALWKAGNGKATGATRRDGDADADRDVDGADFLLLQRQWGTPPQAQPAAETDATPLPEQASAVLMGAGCLAAGALRRGALRASATA